MEEPVVNKCSWKIDDETTFTAYTAEWCNPCKRIKPTVLETFNTFKIIYNDNMPKSVYKENVYQYIPYFTITKNGVLIDSIQTSDSKEFLHFTDAISNVSVLQSKTMDKVLGTKAILKLTEDF